MKKNTPYRVMQVGIAILAVAIVYRFGVESDKPIERPIASDEVRSRDTGGARVSVSSELKKSSVAAPKISSNIPAGAASAPAQTVGYEEWDVQIEKGRVPPSWFYSGRDVYKEIAAIDPLAYVANVDCGEKVCRVEVQHESPEGRARFAQALGRHVLEAHAATRSDNESAVTIEPKAVASDPTDIVSIAAEQEENSATAYFYPEDDRSKTFIYAIKPLSIDDVIAAMTSEKHQ